MTEKTTASIRFLGANRDYADGAEDEVLAALNEVADRSDGSDELFGHAVDWATTYHFSPRRSNLLRPFEINEDHRILEIGAGTGALTRYLGERGAEVVALEGDSLRAQSIARRCSDLTNVEVVCGSLSDYRDKTGFDLVIVVGVLEYAGSASSDDHDQLEFLRHAAALTRPDGALVLAMENQIGLKYLLGYSEDHLNEPWAGIEGYPGRPAVCTVPRARLRSLLEDSGLPAQRLYYPYPDYKLPRTILAEQAFDNPIGTEFVDQLVGRPIQDLANPPTRFCDDRAVHRVFLEAGLGTEVANSFLVVAARQDAALEHLTDDTVIAWHFSSNRLKGWRRSQMVRRSDGELRLTAAPTHPEASTAETTWLEHDPGKDEEFVIGLTLEQKALEFSRNHDMDGLTAVLRQWTGILAEQEASQRATGDGEWPFSPRPGRASLPPEYLDASLSNFVDSGDDVVFVDREWRVGSRVDGLLTRFRAMWYLALELVVSGIPHPFRPDTSVNDLAIRLGELAGLEFDERLIEDFISDEARVQETVTGTPAQRVETDLRALGSTTRSEKEVASTLPVAQIRRDLVQLGGLLGGMESQAEDSRRYQIRLEEDIAATGIRMRELEDEYRRLENRGRQLETQNREIGTWGRQIEAQNEKVEAWARQLEARRQEVETWGKNLEAQNHELETWAKKLETQNEEVETWAKNLEVQNRESETRTKNLEEQNREVETWAKNLEARNREMETWAKDLETHNRELSTYVKSLEAWVRELDLKLTVAERESAERAEECAAIEVRLSNATSEVEELRTWKDRVTRRPLVRIALAVHRFFSRGAD